MNIIAQEGKDDPSRFLLISAADDERPEFGWVLDVDAMTAVEMNVGSATRSGYWVPFDGEHEEAIFAKFEEAEKTPRTPTKDDPPDEEDET